MKAGKKKFRKIYTTNEVCLYAKEHNLSYGKAVIALERIQNDPPIKENL